MGQTDVVQAFESASESGRNDGIPTSRERFSRWTAIDLDALVKNEGRTVCYDLCYFSLEEIKRKTRFWFLEHRYFWNEVDELDTLLTRTFADRFTVTALKETDIYAMRLANIILIDKMALNNVGTEMQGQVLQAFTEAINKARLTFDVRVMNSKGKLKMASLMWDAYFKHLEKRCADINKYYPSNYFTDPLRAYSMARMFEEEITERVKEKKEPPPQNPPKKPIRNSYNYYQGLVPKRIMNQAGISSVRTNGRVMLSEGEFNTVKSFVISRLKEILEAYYESSLFPAGYLEKAFSLFNDLQESPGQQMELVREAGSLIPAIEAAIAQIEFNKNRRNVWEYDEGTGYSVSIPVVQMTGNRLVKSWSDEASLFNGDDIFDISSPDVQKRIRAAIRTDLRNSRKIEEPITEDREITFEWE